MSFARQIKEIRMNTFLSQKEFAKELGVAFSTVNRWEMGKALPSYKAMKAIDEFCKIHAIDYDVREVRDSGVNDNA